MVIPAAGVATGPVRELNEVGCPATALAAGPDATGSRGTGGAKDGLDGLDVVHVITLTHRRGKVNTYGESSHILRQVSLSSDLVAVRLAEVTGR